MPDWPLTLRCAEMADMATIIELIDEAADWLRRTKNTNQWAVPWPDRAGRDGRILSSLRQRKTWICWDQGTPAATLTTDTDHDPYWSQQPGAESAVYAHRLVVAAGMRACVLALPCSTGRAGRGGTHLASTGSGSVPGPPTWVCIGITGVRASACAASMPATATRQAPDSRKRRARSHSPGRRCLPRLTGSTSHDGRR